MHVSRSPNVTHVSAPRRRSQRRRAAVPLTLAVLLTAGAIAALPTVVGADDPASAAVARTAGWRPVGDVGLTALPAEGPKAVQVTADSDTRAGVRRQAPAPKAAAVGTEFRGIARVSTPQQVRLRLVVTEVQAGRVIERSRRTVNLDAGSATLRTRFTVTRPDSSFRLKVVAPSPAASSSFTVEHARARRLPVAETPAPPTGGSGIQVGTQFHGLWQSYTDAQRKSVLDRLVTMGASWVRIDISWAMLQPSRAGAYDTGWGVPFVDRVIEYAHSRGLKVLGTLWLTPSWADPFSGERSAPANPEHYGKALAWAADRWRGKVQAWEVWNEPNSKDFFVGASPREYTKLLCTAYRTVQRTVAKPPTIVYGGTVHNDDAWIAKTYDAGVKGCFDAMATHPYVGPSDASPDSGGADDPWDFARLGAVRELMLSHGDAKPIWATEFGWSSHVNGGGEPSWNRGVTEAQQARYTVAALELLEERFPYVTHAFVYNEREKQTSDPQQRGYGIMRSDLTPKPVYAALRSWLSGR